MLFKVFKISNLTNDANSGIWFLTKRTHVKNIFEFKEFEHHAMATAAAQAIAVATAVSGDSLSDEESEIIIMPNDLKVQQNTQNLKTRNNFDQQW